MSREYSPKKEIFFFFFRGWRTNWVLSLRIMAAWRIREKCLWSGITATWHANEKAGVELTIFFKTRILGHFPDKYHVCCTFRYNFWVSLLKIRKDFGRVACFCLIYIYIPYLWWNYIHSLFFLWYILLWIPACLELVFHFLKKEFTLSLFLFFLLRNQSILEQVEKIIL